MIKRCNLLSIVGTAFCAVLMMVASTSCSGIIYDDLEPCPNGIRLRFVYDYHLEFVNSFHQKVDCVTLYVYDEEGNFVTQAVERTEVLANENYRMQLELEKGNYRLIAYGGLACEQHSFSLTGSPVLSRVSHYTDLKVSMDEGKAGTLLHDLYYGTLEVSVEGNDYVEDTLKMMKNTHHLRVMLQQVNNKLPLDDNCFTFAITDDNTLFAHDNSLLPNGIVNYTPWKQGTVGVGTTPEEEEAKVAFAEFSTSRLVIRENHAPRLIVKNKETEEDVINIPLINYLLLLKSEIYAEMSSQEYLDRENDWSLIFFLDDNGNWLRTHIVINDWVVRLNETDF